MNTELVVIAFKDSTGADEMLQTLQAMQADDFIEVLDAVIVTKDNNHKIDIRRPLQEGTGKGNTASAPASDFKYLPIDELQPGESSLTVYVNEIWIDQVEAIATKLAASIDHEISREERHIAREEAAEMHRERINAAYESWQAQIDKLRTTLASLNQQMSNHVQSQHDALHKQAADTRAKLDATNKNVEQTLRAWQRQIDANIQELEAKAKTADASAKADIDKRLASAKDARQALHTHVKESLASRLNDLKSDINSLKGQATQANAQAKEAINKQVANLQAGWESEKKRLSQLESTDDAAWDEMVKSMSETMDAYEESIRKAELAYEAA
jgi:hypothetical protein